MTTEQIKQAAPVTLNEFYAETLRQNGVAVPDAVDIEKVAAAKGVPTEIAEIAQQIYNQMILDGVVHASPAEKVADAFAMAKSFLSHNKAIADFGATLASDLKIACAAAAQEVLKKHGVELSTYDAVKMAEQELAFVTVTPEQLKSAQAVVLAAAVEGEDAVKRASAAAVLPTYDIAGLYAGQADASTLNLPAFYEQTGTHFGGDAALGQKIASALAGSEKTADHRGAAHAFVLLASNAQSWSDSAKTAAAFEEQAGVRPSVEWFLNARRADEIQLRANLEK